MALLALTLDPVPGQAHAVRVWYLPDDSAELVAGLLAGMLGPPHEALTSAETAEEAAAHGEGKWVITSPVDGDTP